jgi:hypothetical protein
MKPTILCSVCFCLVINPLVSSAETPAAPETRKSSFQTKGPTRNPFWPVGWSPTTREAVVVKEEVTTISEDSFNLSAILLGPPHYAVINGKDYGEGALIPMEVDGKLAQVQLVKIVDGYVVLNHLGKGITVALRRK